MAEEQTGTTPAETPAQESPTLDSVYKEYGIDDQAAQYQQARQQPQHVQQPQPAPQQVPLTIPDPTLDPSGHQQFTARYIQHMQQQGQSLAQVTQQLTQMQAQQLREREEADIKTVRSVLSEKVPGVDGRVLEAHLGVMAREDPRLMALWQQRAQKPEAWQKALNVVGSQMASMYSAKVDPQLTENTRAMRAATQAASTSRAKDGEKTLSDDPREFGKQWEQYLSQNTY